MLIMLYVAPEPSHPESPPIHIDASLSRPIPTFQVWPGPLHLKPGGVRMDRKISHLF